LSYSAATHIDQDVLAIASPKPSDQPSSGDAAKGNSESMVEGRFIGCHSVCRRASDSSAAGVHRLPRDKQAHCRSSRAPYDGVLPVLLKPRGLYRSDWREIVHCLRRDVGRHDG
jgi:hypothetical protein